MISKAIQMLNMYRLKPCDSSVKEVSIGPPPSVIASEAKPFDPELTAEGQSPVCLVIRKIATALCASQ